jgi:hypothetical protein
MRDKGGVAPALETAGDIRAAVADLEKRSIEAALASAGGNKSRAAAELGISRFALQRKLDKYDVGHTRDRAKKDGVAENGNKSAAAAAALAPFDSGDPGDPGDPGSPGIPDASEGGSRGDG